MSTERGVGTPTMSASTVLDIVQEMYSGAGWVFLRELKLGTGKSKRNPARGQPRSIKQRLDAWAYNTWPSTPGIVTFEIKCSRKDFLLELSKPSKRSAGMAISNQFYFVTAPGVATHEEIPPGCGWIELQPVTPYFEGLYFGARIIEAPWTPIPLHSSSLPTHLINSLIRRLGRAEGTYVAPIRKPRRARRRVTRATRKKVNK